MFRPIILFFALCAAAFATVTTTSADRRIDELDTPLTKGTANEAEVQLALQIAEKTRCDPNICFAVDGSGSMDVTEFQLEKDFTNLVAAVVAYDEQARFAAVQYGLRPKFISRLTEDADAFLEAVHYTESLNAPRTFIAPGLAGCIRQFYYLKGEPKHIVLLGDGRSNFDSKLPPLDPVSIAQAFLANPNNTISAVGVGFDADDTMLTNIAGGEENVFNVGQWLEVTTVLAELVGEVCGLDAVEF
ncbi:Collagen alpha-5(VI) chain [Gracilariopsis chorda]|uniref:Collagen alpha-5(VI) chain n=1 Tax=Gracilariopsis chorda TaxID=448386 RepID=A0A2V3IQR5_9FLOR|nr:Collagen alpha-5(VI) chain [Gracilariopsis chorda]|eukprot:PXF44452.1 Collagen alpha-5(VI) chain [Gracilariopsis chorda]